MSGESELDVWVELDGQSVQAGRAFFTRGRGGVSSTVVTLQSSYIGNPSAYAFDPKLRLTTGAQHVSGFLPAFSDATPDRWGRNLIARRMRATAAKDARTARTLDEFDYLIGVSDTTRQGALRFTRVDSPDYLDATGKQVPPEITLPKLLHAAQEVSRDVEGSLEATKLLLDAGTGSLGGANPKASVLLDNRRLAIAKFQHAESEHDVLRWEYVALEVAAAARIAIPAHRLIKLGSQAVHVLERFDRQGTNRIGYISALTLLGRTDGEASDYLEIAERLPSQSVRSQNDLDDLFKRVVLNVVLNNTDDHLRNLGCIRHGQGWSLAPAFDINPNPITSVMRQTSIAGADSLAEEVKSLSIFAEACRIKPERATELALQVCAAGRTADDCAESVGIAQAERSRFVSMFNNRSELVASHFSE